MEAVGREQLGVGVLGIFEDVARRGGVGEIDALAVGREHRLAQLLLIFGVGPLDQRDALSAGEVIHPDLAGAERASGREMLARGDIFPVRTPGRIVEEGERSEEHTSEIKSLMRISYAVFCL